MAFTLICAPDPLGELKRSPDPVAAIWGLLLKKGEVEERERKREGRGRGRFLWGLLSRNITLQHIPLRDQPFLQILHLQSNPKMCPMEL